MNLHLSIWNDIVSIKIYDKRDDFDFDIVNFKIFGGDPRSIFYGAYISQLNIYARASSHAADFNTRNKLLPQNFLNKTIGITIFAKKISIISLIVWFFIWRHVWEWKTPWKTINKPP